MRHRLAEVLSVSVLFWAAACGKPPQPESPAGEESAFLVHVTTQKNEKPQQIAKWYLGSPEKWTEILAHNKTLEGKKKLAPGEVVLIPLESITTLEPMPTKAQAPEAVTQAVPSEPVEGSGERVAPHDPFLDGDDEGSARPVVNAAAPGAQPGTAENELAQSVVPGSLAEEDEQAEIDRLQREIEEARLKASGRMPR